MKTSKTIRRIATLAGLTILAASASAISFNDAKIMIDRALNSPILTVRYTGANAALVELRVNGESLGTRTVTASQASGETNFTLNLSELKDGDNEVEIRLFDRTGKLVGSDHTNISTEQSMQGPVYLTTPKMGASVMGPVEIKVGFGQTLKSSYVSFFVDNNFKAMTNFPPYSFVWDTTRETNGWHEVEAWAIDDASTTYKTRKVRIFVNNPGGRTDRPGVEDDDLTPTRNPSHEGILGAEAGIRGANGHSKTTGGVSVMGVPPVSSGIRTLDNVVRATLVGSMSGTKPAYAGSVVATGVQHLTPTGRRVAVTKKVGVIEVHPSNHTFATNLQVRSLPSTVLAGVKAANLITITKGQRLPNLTSFAVVYNTQFVNFDVAPRVDDGVPMTPFRHLLEKAGGKVKWENMTKSVDANADGKHIFLQIGDSAAKINDLSIRMETAPYIDHGRTIVPLSFMRDALNVNIQYDKSTNHVLITSTK